MESEIQIALKIYQYKFKNHQPVHTICDKLGIDESEVYRLIEKYQITRSGHQIPTSIPEGESIISETTKKMPVNLSRAVLERFLSPQELEEFFAKYSEHNHKGVHTRGRMFEKVITKKALESIRKYVTEPNLPVKDIASQLEVPANTLFSNILRIALTIVAQHPEVLESVKTSD